MANQINTKNIAIGTFVCTVTTLANGTARQSDMIDNSTTDYPAALVYVEVASGATTPTAGNTIEVYLLRSNIPGASSTYRTDGAGTGDANIGVENATMLGAIVCTATTNKKFYGEFDTAFTGVLGPEWGIAVKNTSGGSLHATAGSHSLTYVNYVPEIQ